MFFIFLLSDSFSLLFKIRVGRHKTPHLAEELMAIHSLPQAGRAIFLNSVWPQVDPRLSRERPHTKEYLVLFVTCFGFVFKRRLRFGWVGKGVNLSRTGRRVNMVRIYCIKFSKN